MESVFHWLAIYLPDVPVIYTLGGAGDGSNGFPEWVGEDELLEAWREYVRYVVQRYAGRVQYLEVWNEPDSFYWFIGNTALLVELTRITVEEAAGVMQVISPAFTDQGLQMMEDFQQRGGFDGVDIVGFHLGWLNERRDTAYVKRAKQLAGPKPLWITETNLLTTDPMRAFDLMHAHGADMIAYYSWEMWSYGQAYEGTDYVYMTKEDGSLTNYGEQFIERVGPVQPLRSEP